MKFYISVENAGEGESLSILNEFAAKAKPELDARGVQISMAFTCLAGGVQKPVLLIACPTRAAKNELRSLLKNYPEVREETVPPPDFGRGFDI